MQGGGEQELKVRAKAQGSLACMSAREEPPKRAVEMRSCFKVIRILDAEKKKLTEPSGIRAACVEILGSTGSHDPVTRGTSASVCVADQQMKGLGSRRAECASVGVSSCCWRVCEQA